MNCKICNLECRSNRSLSKHIRDKHPEYSSRSYYDEFIKTDNDGRCKVCNISTLFTNLTIGYKNTCGHKCAGILVRQELSADKEKHEKFKEKVAKNQTDIWRQRKLTGEAETIHKKVSNTVKKKNANLTKEELRAKYGWLNKLTEDRKKDWIESVQKQTGMYIWWKTVNEEDKEDTIKRRNATKLGISIEEYENRYKNINEFENYRWVVWILTERTYKEFKHIIDPENKRSPSYHLDHKFSVIRGFQTQVPPEIIASIHNLEILPSSANASKSGKCSINIENLKEMYYDKVFPRDISSN